MSASADRGRAYIDTTIEQRRANQSRAKRLPPYGRELRDLRVSGLVPATMVIVGLDTWDFGKGYARCVIPIDSEPADFNFDFIAALDVVLVWAPYLTLAERKDLALRALLASDPVSLRCIVLSDPIQWIWIKSRKYGLEQVGYQQ